MAERRLETHSPAAREIEALPPRGWYTHRLSLCVGTDRAPQQVRRETERILPNPGG